MIFLLCVVLPALLIFIILYVCKKYNFSIIPDNLKIDYPEPTFGWYPKHFDQDEYDSDDE